jgi:hypothetical protein
VLYGSGMRRAAGILVIALAIGAPAAALIGAEDAAASVAYASPYTFEQTFGSALRLVRVDLGCKITEKDEANGYVLFDYTSLESGKKVHRGSLEVVRTKQGAHVAVQLASLPSYHEQMIVDALIKKLAAEHGEPPAKGRAAPAEDAGAGADGG